MIINLVFALLVGVFGLGCVYLGHYLTLRSWAHTQYLPVQMEPEGDAYTEPDPYEEFTLPEDIEKKISEGTFYGPDMVNNHGN